MSGVVNVVIRKVGALWEVELLEGKLPTWKGSYKTEVGAKRGAKRLVSRYDVTLVDEKRAIECTGSNPGNSVGARRGRAGQRHAKSGCQ